MSTQAVTATVGTNRMSKIFGGTITDEVWTNLQDTNSSTNLGILIPRAVVSKVQAEYTAGLAAWRIQNAQTLFVSRRGWAALEDNSCYHSAGVTNYAVAPDDIIQMYAMPVDSTSNKSNALAWVTTSKGTELYQAKAVADGTATAMTTALQNQSLGDAAFNSTLTSFSVCVEDGAQLDKVEFIDSAGGVQLTIQGNTRIPNGTLGGGTSAYYNLDATGLALPITKGFTMKITTKSA